MIYFDNSATTRVLPQAIAAAEQAMGENFFNPSGAYGGGGAGGEDPPRREQQHRHQRNADAAAQRKDEQIAPQKAIDGFDKIYQQGRFLL